MRAVLYTNDMIPITVLELNVWCDNHLRKHGCLRLPVIEPVQCTLQHDIPTSTNIKTVMIKSETLIRHGKECLMLFTADEEHALMLQSAFLPGQQFSIRDRERKAFAQGFLSALAKMGAIK